MTSIHSQSSQSQQIPINKKPVSQVPPEMQQKLQELLGQAEQGRDQEASGKLQDLMDKIGGDIGKLPNKLQSRLERFLNKIDRNDDGHLSRAELRSMADTNNDGYVSRGEKKEMRAKLNDYLKDKAAIETLNSETSRQVSEAIEFLDEPSLIQEIEFPPKPPKPQPFPVEPARPINWHGDDFIAKYATTFCTRSKRA